MSTSNRETHKERFYSKLEAANKVNSHIISRKELERVKEYLLDPSTTNVTKSFKKKIKKNQFKLVTLGCETNVVCTTVASEGENNKVILFIFLMLDG